MLDRHALVICDEAFLPLVPEAEAQSMITLVDQHPNLVVIRSLTKLFGVAGLRVGYAVSQPDRLKRWKAWRDPWPVNGIAAALTEQWLGRPRRTLVPQSSALDGEPRRMDAAGTGACTRHHADAFCGQLSVDLRPSILASAAGSFGA
jgi:histidinol-phosphate/aromatic aminotransferase/cobyric acid decarboxylase-like protein